MQFVECHLHKILVDGFAKLCLKDGYEVTNRAGSIGVFVDERRRGVERVGKVTVLVEDDEFVAGGLDDEAFGAGARVGHGSWGR